MAKPGNYIVVHMVERQEVGQHFRRKRLDWPLHVTLASWFYTPDITACQTELGRMAAGIEPFETIVGQDTAFGADGEIPVNLVEDQETMRKLHQVIRVAIVQAKGEFEDERWINERYRAHITHHGEHRAHPGDVELIDDFHLVRVNDEDMCEVIGRFAFGVGGGHETTA